MPVLRIYMQSHADRPGSICCLARDPAYPSSLYLVSAGHVLAPLEVPDIAAVRRMRIPIICEFLAASPQPVGTLFDWQRLEFDGTVNAFDAGVVEVNPGAAEALLRTVPLPTGVTNLAEENWDVCTSGAESNMVSHGHIRERQVDGLVLNYITPGNLLSASFEPGNHFSSDPISVEGDSGAPAFDPSGRLAGLLVGGRDTGDQRSYFSRIGPVLARFGLKPVLHAHYPAGISALSLWGQSRRAPPMAAPAPDPTVDVLARTLWGEARGEGRAGIEGVACVVINRAERGPKYWWGGTIADVCKRPNQFSCWNPNDPNRARLLAVSGDDASFRICVEAAQSAAAGTLTDVTAGATHYHVDTMMPSWARGKTPCAHIGHHVFYNDIE